MLENQKIVVVGANGLIGREVVCGLLSRGAHVVSADLTLPSGTDADRDMSGFIEYTVVDISDSNSIKKLFEEHPDLTGAVNSAYPRGPGYGKGFLEVTIEDFNRNVSLHLGGYFLFMQSCVRHALEFGKEFSLVNLSSVYGVVPPRFEIYTDTQITMPVEYAAIKAGLLHLNRYVTAYTKGSNFRVNSVSPGGIFDNHDDKFREKYDSFCRVKGMLDPVDIVGAIAFLLSNDARFVCGQNIIVDDGFT